MTAPARPVFVILAGVAAPVAVTGLAFVLSHMGAIPLLIAVFAGVFGTASFILLGVPALVWATRRYGATLPVFVVAALLANLGSPLALSLQSILTGFGPRLMDGAALTLGWGIGSLFAALWGAAAWFLYRVLIRGAARFQ